MKVLKKKSSIASNRKRRHFKNSLRMKKMNYNIKYSPKNTSQFLIKNHINNKNNDLDEEDLIPSGSMINVFDLHSENSTTDEDEENILFC